MVFVHVNFAGAFRPANEFPLERGQGFGPELVRV
jgi:hypothetical protein